MQLIQYILMKIEDISVQKINSNIFNYICNCVEQETPVPHNLFFYLRKEFFMSKRKFFITGTVVGSLLLTQSVFAAEITATPSQNTLSVQSESSIEKVEAVPAYLYQDNNYFMLRDIGKIVGYQVNWDENTKQISMVKDESAQNLTGMSQSKQAESVTKSKQTLIIDGKEYSDKECLNIDGYNYFKLRDMAEIMNFTCSWDNATSTIILILDKENATEDSDIPETNISIDRFLDSDLDQKIIEKDVVYVSGSNDYSEIEKYIKENIDQNFSINDYDITEDNMNGLLPGYDSLIMRLNVNGVSANYGYIVTCLNGKAALITFIGEKNTDFNMANTNESQLSDEEAKQKAIEADGYDYKVDEQRIHRYFDMKDLTYKCEVETVYIDDSGHYFATSNIF